MEKKPAIQTKKRKHTLPWIWLALALVYTISPIDFIPDTFPILGWLDDISLLTAAILNLFQKYHEETHKQLALTLKYLKWLFLLFAILLIVLLGILGYLVFFNN